MSDMLHFPRSAAVKATRLTADSSSFCLSFNNGRGPSGPFAMDNGLGIFIGTVTMNGDGKVSEMKPTEMHLGDWVTEGANGVEVHAAADFSANFCSIAS
jgi:hypothetical protein